MRTVSRAAIAVCLGFSGVACLHAAEAERAHDLLAAGQVQEAARIARTSRAADDRTACVWGEIQFRRAAFDEAASAFAEAARLNPENARAWWGLGRIEEIRFRRERARDLFAKAYRLDPRDSDIVLSYLNVVSEPRC